MPTFLTWLAYQLAYGDSYAIVHVTTKVTKWQIFSSANGRYDPLPNRARVRCGCCKTVIKRPARGDPCAPGLPYSPNQDGFAYPDRCPIRSAPWCRSAAYRDRLLRHCGLARTIALWRRTIYARPPRAPRTPETMPRSDSPAQLFAVNHGVHLSHILTHGPDRSYSTPLMVSKRN